MILRRRAGAHVLRWTGSAPDVDVLPSGRIRAAVDGLVIDQPTAAEWFVEVEPEGVHLGTKWLARARIVLRHAQELHVESAQETTQRPVATGPAVVTIATRDLEVTDLLEGREVSHRGDDTEHDLRIHVQVLPGSGGSAEESRADVQGREATPRSTYTWVLSEEGPGVACCVTVVAGVGPDEVLRRLGADVSRTLDPESRADDMEVHGRSVAATAVPGGVVVVEPNGFQCSREELLLRAAGDSAAASVFWDVNSDNAFVAARAGAVVVNVDMYDFLDAADPVVLEELDLPAELQSLCLEAAEVGEEPWATGLAMAETFTRVAIPRAAVVEPAALHPLPQH